MQRQFTKNLLLLLLILPCFAEAARFRIDPQPENSQTFDAIARRPWEMITLPARSALLTLLNFVVDPQADQQEGRDFPKYDRLGQFGTWKYLNPHDNCYNTRADILIRDSLDPVTFTNSHGCTVKTGRWHDTYTGGDFSAAVDIQIDHIVPLKNAYDSGAWQWEAKRRCHYANFLSYGSHLIPVSAKENMRKGDRSPAHYMPPDPHVTCAYLQHWLNVKAVWDLTLEEDEAAAINQLMQSNHCSLKFQTVTDSALSNQRREADDIIPACANVQ